MPSLFYNPSGAPLARAPRLRAHHVVPREEGGPDALENLTTLCNPCHRRVHNDIASRGAAGWAAVMRPDAGPETALASLRL